MAAINAIAREWADEIRDGIAWVLIWKTGQSWNAHAVWLNSDDDTFEPEDLELARKVLEQDPKAVMVNGYYCGHFGEDMTLAELADGIRWNYENSCNLLDGSTAFPPGAYGAPGRPSGKPSVVRKGHQRRAGSLRLRRLHEPGGLRAHAQEHGGGSAAAGS